MNNKLPTKGDRYKHYYMGQTVKVISVFNNTVCLKYELTEFGGGHNISEFLKEYKLISRGIIDDILCPKEQEEVAISKKETTKEQDQEAIMQAHAESGKFGEITENEHDILKEKILMSAGAIKSENKTTVRENRRVQFDISEMHASKEFFKYHLGLTDYFDHKLALKEIKEAGQILIDTLEKVAGLEDDKMSHELYKIEEEIKKIKQFLNLKVSN